MTAKFLIVCGGSGEYVLGQRKVLGLRGEMQIDVMKELEDTRRRLGRIQDDYSKQVRADIGESHVKALFNSIDTIANLRHWDEHAREHAKFVSKNWIRVNALIDGLAQSATIGGLAISHPEAQLQLEGGIKNLLRPIEAGSDLEFWIISSTAGGTGEGTHRAVAEKIIEVVRTQQYGLLKLKFIRIGSATYQKISGQRAAISTFFGLAADAIFENEVGYKFGANAASVYWFYLDFPDYGEGDDAKGIRGPVIELGAKALMLDELARDLDQLAVNANTIICRVGFWGKKYDENDLYAAALEGLLVKLEQFINPPEERLTPPGLIPRFDPGGLKDVRVTLTNQDYLVNMIDSVGWQMANKDAPKDLDSLEQYLNECETNLTQLLKHEFAYKSFTPISQYKLSEVSEGVVVEVKFESKSQTENVGRKGWFDDVRTAQSICAWTLKLLGIRRTTKPESSARKSKQGWYRDDGLLFQLFKAQNECGKIFNFQWAKNSQVKAGQLSKKLGDYMDLLTQVRILYDEFKKSQNLLNVSMSETQTIVDFAREKLRFQPPRPGDGAPIVVAELDDELDRLYRLTWFKLVYDEVSQKRADTFRVEVMRGAVGLTKRGLRDVLNISPAANTEAIKSELRENVGRMYLMDGTEIKALWFGGQDPLQRGNNRYFYRMLPRLEAGFDLGVSREGDISYIYPPLGILGLKVLALEGVTIAKANDEIETHAWLASSFVKPIRELLSDENWTPHIRGNAGSKLQVATSMVIGEPLSEEVLSRAGLTDKEIDRLKEYLYIKKFTDEPEEKAKNGE